MDRLIDGNGLHTVCHSAQCPNSGECFSRQTATFLILGNTCTRKCTFCAVTKGTPSAVDPKEPRHVREAATALDLKYVVVTSVTRDDLADGGSSHFHSVVRELHKGAIAAEVLVPDFKGSAAAIGMVMDSAPEVLNHNIETVPRLYHEVRPGADYARSLELLEMAKRMRPDAVTKSGLMLGLGETEDEVTATMRDLREAGCDLLTIGQYLQPSPAHHSVARFVRPEEFEAYARMAKEMGFAAVASAPLVRSSFHASEMYAQIKGRA